MNLPRRWPSQIEGQRLLLGALGALLVVFLLVPLLALFVTASPGQLAEGLRHPLVWPALGLSLSTTSLSLLLVLGFGTPLSWVLAHSRTSGARALETCLQLPMVVPPAVAGVALLLAFGRRGLLASWAYPEGWSVAFTTAAVVMAQTFVSAPFFLQAATAAFRRLDPNLLVVARTFGASPLRVFIRVGLPLAGPGLVTGAAMSWARALGEFGATLMFAGNLEGHTQTLPLAIYTALASDLRAAQALSVILVVVAFALLLGVRGVFHRTAAKEPRT
ncbi:MAG: ABC transporter permease [Myxococcales bacterium]|nr:ABC transporter permease [Myxococcales bacterium]